MMIFCGSSDTVNKKALAASPSKVEAIGIIVIYCQIFVVVNFLTTFNYLHCDYVKHVRTSTENYLLNNKAVSTQ